MYSSLNVLMPSLSASPGSYELHYVDYYSHVVHHEAPRSFFLCSILWDQFHLKSPCFHVTSRTFLPCTWWNADQRKDHSRQDQLDTLLGNIPQLPHFENGTFGLFHLLDLSLFSKQVHSFLEFRRFRPKPSDSGLA